jgi:hypothetical protein
MLVAAAFGCPDESILGFEKAQVVVQVDPGRARLAQHSALVQAVGIDHDQVETLLIAALALERERARIGKPGDTREIDIRVLPEIDPAHARGARLHQTELDRYVRPSGGRIALADGLGAIGIDLAALDLVDARFVVALERDLRIVRRPPVAGRAIHLLLRDELGLGVVYRALAVERQLVVQAGAQIDRVQILLADERHVTPLRRHLRIDDVETARRQRAQLGAGFRVEIVKPQSLADAEQQFPAVRRPAIRGDPAQLRRALALATRLLRIGQFGAGAKLNRIDELARRAGGHFIDPQIELVLIVLAPTQERDAAAVRRDLQRARTLPVEVGIAVDAFDRQFFGHGRHRNRHRGGVEQDAHRDLPGEARLSLRGGEEEMCRTCGMWPLPAG